MSHLELMHQKPEPQNIETKKLTIVINTRVERENYLNVTLSSILSQSFTDWDLLIVYGDKSNTFGDKLTASILKTIRENGHKISEFRMQGGQNFLTGLNEAILTVKTPFLLKCDDDIYLSPYYIDKLFQFIVKKEIGAVCGTVLSLTGDPYSTFGKDKICVMKDFEIPTTLNLNTFDFNKETLDQPVYFRNVRMNTQRMYFSHRLPGDAVLFKTTVVQKVGYDPKLAYPFICDDLDISLGIRALGYKLIFVPNGEIWHLSCNDYTRCFDKDETKRVFDYLKNKYEGKI